MPLLLLIPIFLGLILLRRGLRGRQIDDHPLCRRCGFDLTGRPSGSSNCAECGATLDHPRAVRIGHTRRLRSLITVGLLILTLSLTAFTRSGWMDAQRIDWIRYEPGWWLVRQTNATAATLRDQALIELLRRMRIKSLSSANIDTLTTRALDLQGDRTKPWVVSWGDLVEVARATGELSDEKWSRYATQAIAYQLIVRCQIRRTPFAAVPMLVKELPVRVGSGCPLWYRNEYCNEGTELSDPDFPNMRHDFSRFDPNFSSAVSYRVALNRSLVKKARDGTKTARLAVAMRVFDTPLEDGRSVLPIAEFTVHLQAPWELVPETVPTVHLIRDSQYAAAMQKAVSVGRLSIESKVDGKCVFWINLTHPPVLIVASAFLRAQGREWPIGSVTCRAGDHIRWDDVSEGCEALNASVADMILRPDIGTAENSISLDNIWGDEIVIKNVPVIYEDAHARKAAL